MDAECPKCGSTAILRDVPVVHGVDRLSAGPVSALAYQFPEARIFKGPVAHRFLARICGACGYSEFYVEDPKGLMATIQKTDAIS